jgi:hypothetical protein
VILSQLFSWRTLCERPFSPFKFISSTSRSHNGEAAALLDKLHALPAADVAANTSVIQYVLRRDGVDKETGAAVQQ